ncbi:MAG: hypothetical protein AAB655_01335 [Patescibacteria group bacterium]
MDGKIPSQNLIQQVNPASPLSHPGLYKSVIFDALTVLSAAAVSFLYRGYIADGYSFWFLSGGLVLFAAFSVIQSLLTKSPGRRFLVILLKTIALLSFFYYYDTLLLVATGVAVFVFLLWGESTASSELENTLEIKFFKTAGIILRKITTALVLLFVGLYLPLWMQSNTLIPQDNFLTFFNWTANFVTTVYPEINLNSTFGKFTENIAVFILSDNQTFKDLPPQGRQAAIAQTAKQIADGFSKSVGANISPDEPVSDFVYRYTTKSLADWRSRFDNLFIAVWALVVFIFIRGFGFLFYSIAAVVSFLLYQILLSTGFIHLIGESRTHEIVEF